MDVYRTSVSGGSPSTTGYIGTTICPFGACHFVDNGIAVTTPSNLEPAPPSVNTSGAIAGYTLRTLANCVAAGTAASTSVVSCGAAPAGMVYCDVDASAATCVVDTTAVTTHSMISITPNSANGTPLGGNLQHGDDFRDGADSGGKIHRREFHHQHAHRRHQWRLL